MKCTTANVNLTLEGAYKWDIRIPDERLDSTEKYKLMFKPSSKEFIVADAEIASPGILIKKGAAPSSASPTLSTSTTTSISTPTSLPPILQPSSASHISSSSTQPTPTTEVGTSMSPSQSITQPASSTFVSSTRLSTASSTSPASATQTESSPPPSTSQSPSTKTIAAAATGAIAGVILIILAIIFLCRRHRTAKTSPRHQPHRRLFNRKPKKGTARVQGDGVGSASGSSTTTGRTYSDLSPVTPSFMGYYFRKSSVPSHSQPNLPSSTSSKTNPPHSERGRESWWRNLAPVLPLRLSGSSKGNDGEMRDGNGTRSMAMSERSQRSQRTYYSPDDIVIYPPPELGLGLGMVGSSVRGSGKVVGEHVSTAVAELSGESIPWSCRRDDLRERWKRGEKGGGGGVVELDGDGSGR